MRGCRPLTPGETQAVLDAFQHTQHTARNRAMFITQLTTGVRISELLSLKRGDVLDGRRNIYSEVRFQRGNVKGKQSGKIKPLPPIAQKALREWLEEQQTRWGGVLDHHPVFSTTTLRPLTRQRAYEIYRQAYRKAGLSDQRGLATHTLRKTYAARLYDDYLRRMANGERIDPQRMTGKMLNHQSVNSTENYLSFRQDEAEKSLDAVLEGIKL